ncbi:MAG TPA: PP2C family protein-serine/threonine phosphatase [Phycisphaerales bacterium]|nr:PP2C family protein-serine/threonine phosphatase [Phycisphaerales bacterium]
MQHLWNVVVAALSDETAQAEQRCSELSEQLPGVANFSLIQKTALETQSLEGVDAVVLIAASNASQSTVIPLLATIEEAGVPVIALLDANPAGDNPFTFGGAIVHTQSEKIELIAASLRGILHRQSTVRQLRKELAVAQRFHGGLKGEISKMHEELQLAAMVQREFLPREVPSLHGVQIAALWRPTNYVSGDIYDVTRLDEDHVGIFIADSVGHGVPAALMTMVICLSLVTKHVTSNAYRILPPSEVLRHLNQEMIRRQGLTTRFATAVYAVVNCRTRTVSIAGAGHPPPLRLMGDGQSELIETQGGLLGIFPDEQFPQVDIDLGVNDRLLFHTDGFEQAFPTATSDTYGRRLPTTRYRDEFDRLIACATPEAMTQMISERLDDQQGSLHQVDDLTLICLMAGPLVEGEPKDGTEDSIAVNIAA